MRNTVAKALRKKAAANESGKKNPDNKKEYKRLKKEYRIIKGQI